MCICDSKKTKTVPESMRGRTWGSLLPLFSFLSPFSPFFPLSPVSLIFSHPSPFFHPLLSPTPCLPSPFSPHLCGHDCCEYHTHICVAQGWKFNILVAQCYTCMIKQECWKNSNPAQVLGVTDWAPVNFHHWIAQALVSISNILFTIKSPLNFWYWNKCLCWIV